MPFDPVEPVVLDHTAFVGKTIKLVDMSCVNLWYFEFTDGTKVQITPEKYGIVPGLIATEA